ncbi:MAG: BON domain-containing protein [Epsilonproteobacteria bacterium]|nr:BON domain-containing protein [Campylobacterota bacterium]
MRFLLIALLAIFLGGCISTDNPYSESPVDYLKSSALTAKVKAALIREVGLEGLDIHVNSYKNVVQLSGFVDTEAQKELAGEIAKSVDGVREVVNNIIVKGS